MLKYDNPELDRSTKKKSRYFVINKDSDRFPKAL